MLSLLLPFYAFVVGTIVGSFLNVVIHRYPREESIVFPGSHCPACNAAIRWFDNVPIVSYLLLLGRCRKCRTPISVRYLLVELANGLFYLALYLRTGPTLTFLFLAAIVSMTIALIYIDAEIQILPDVIDLPGVAIGLLTAWVAKGVAADLLLAADLTDALLGMVGGGGLLFAVGFAYKLLRKVEGMGLGDVKMLAMIGAVTGWRGVLAVLFVSTLSGAVIGLAIAVVQRRDLKFAIPFGVFLGFGFLAILFFGNDYFTWLPILAPRD